MARLVSSATWWVRPCPRASSSMPSMDDRVLSQSKIISSNGAQSARAWLGIVAQSVSQKLGDAADRITQFFGATFVVNALSVVVQVELVGMRAQPHGVDFARPLVIDPGLQHVTGEDIARQQ